MSPLKNKIAVVTGGKTDITKLDDLNGFYGPVAKKGKIDVIFAGAASSKR